MMGGKVAVPEFVSLNILVGARERHDLSSNSLLKATRIDLTLQSHPLLIGSINRPLNCLSFLDNFPCIVHMANTNQYYLTCSLQLIILQNLNSQTWILCNFNLRNIMKVPTRVAGDLSSFIII